MNRPFGTPRKPCAHHRGKRSGEQLLVLHRWYESLPTRDRQMLKQALQLAADSAVFGMLCLMDNVRPVTDGGAVPTP